MVTLQENSVKFNNNLIIYHDSGRLSGDSRLFLIDELIDAFNSPSFLKRLFDLTTAVNIGRIRIISF